MNKKIKNLIRIFLASFFALAFFAAPAFASAAVDLDSLKNEGIKILQIGNFTNTPGSTNWQNNSISADAGDVIILLVHYHNFTNGEVAKNVKIKTSFPSSSSTNHTISVSLRADNSAIFPDSASVNISSSQTISFISDSVLNYPKGGGGISISGSNIISSSGLNIGDVNYGNEESGYISFKLQISSVQTSSPTPTVVLPSVNTRSASDITDSSATLKGSANPKGVISEAWFEWGSSADGLVNETSHQNVGSGNSYIDYLSGLSGLSYDATYYFRAVARNANGIVYGSTYNFKTRTQSSSYIPSGGGGGGTGSCIPIVTTKPASFITNNSVSLRAAVNPGGRSTSGWFEYGKSYALTLRTASQNVGSGSVDNDLLNYLPNLEPNTTYYFRAIGENNCGRAQGSILSFTTEVLVAETPKAVPAAPQPITPAPAPKAPVVSFSVWKEVKNLTFPNGTTEIVCAAIGDTIEFSLNIKNKGTNSLSNVLVKDSIPDEFEFTGSLPDVKKESGNNLEWSLSSVAPGETKTIVLQVKVKKISEPIATENYFTASGNGLEKTSNKTTVTLNPVSREQDIGMFAAVGLAFSKIPCWLWMILTMGVCFFYTRYAISKKLKE